jgi:hypothetical protein
VSISVHPAIVFGDLVIRKTAVHEPHVRARSDRLERDHHDAGAKSTRTDGSEKPDANTTRGGGSTSRNVPRISHGPPPRAAPSCTCTHAAGRRVQRGVDGEPAAPLLAVDEELEHRGRWRLDIDLGDDAVSRWRPPRLPLFSFGLEPQRPHVHSPELLDERPHLAETFRACPAEALRADQAFGQQASPRRQ